MCLLCIEFQKGGMTIVEARKALNEMIDTPSSIGEPDFWHFVELSEAKDLEGELNGYEGDD